MFQTLHFWLSRYRYLIIVNGNTVSSSRTATFFQRCGSLIFMHESVEYEFWYHGLRPYVHYIPLTSSVQDVRHKLEWAERNPEMARRIALNGWRFGQEYLGSEPIACYMRTLLQSYGELMRYKPQLTPLYESWKVHLGKSVVGVLKRSYPAVEQCAHRVVANPLPDAEIASRHRRRDLSLL